MRQLKRELTKNEISYLNKIYSEDKKNIKYVVLFVAFMVFALLVPVTYAFLIERFSATSYITLLVLGIGIVTLLIRLAKRQLKIEINYDDIVEVSGKFRAYTTSTGGGERTPITRYYLNNYYVSVPHHWIDMGILVDGCGYTCTAQRNVFSDFLSQASLGSKASLVLLSVDNNCSIDQEFPLFKKLKNTMPFKLFLLLAIIPMGFITSDIDNGTISEFFNYHTKIKGNISVFYSNIDITKADVYNRQYLEYKNVIALSFKDKGDSIVLKNKEDLLSELNSLLPIIEPRNKDVSKMWLASVYGQNSNYWSQLSLLSDNPAFIELRDLYMNYENKNENENDKSIFAEQRKAIEADFYRIEHEKLDEKLHQLLKNGVEIRSDVYNYITFSTGYRSSSKYILSYVTLPFIDQTSRELS